MPPMADAAWHGVGMGVRVQPMTRAVVALGICGKKSATRFVRLNVPSAGETTELREPISAGAAGPRRGQTRGDGGANRNRGTASVSPVRSSPTPGASRETPGGIAPSRVDAAALRPATGFVMGRRAPAAIRAGSASCGAG